jgi:hypothetical protein
MTRFLGGFADMKEVLQVSHLSRLTDMPVLRFEEDIIDGERTLFPECGGRHPCEDFLGPRAENKCNTET